MRNLAIFFVALFFTVSTAFANPSTDPKIQVTNTIEEILVVVEKLPGDANKTARREKLREVINPRFDFDEMSKRSLGALWNDATPEQQNEFVSVFSNLLAKTYLARIETIERGMVAILNAENRSDPADPVARSVVKTTVTSKGDTFPIDYKLQALDGKNWRVYDVVIENIGLVSNYRNEFAGIVRKEKFDGLLKRLREKKDPA